MIIQNYLKHKIKKRPHCGEQTNRLLPHVASCWAKACRADFRTMPRKDPARSPGEELSCTCQCSNSDSLKSSQLASRILPGPILIEMSYADVIKKFQSWYGRANNAEASFKQIGILHWDICGANFCGAPLQGMVQGFNPQALAAPQDAPRKEARHDLNETKQHTQTNTPSGRGQSHAITHWQC